MNRIWLLTVTGAGTLILMLTAFMMLQQIRRQQRLSSRIHLSQGRAPLRVAAQQDMVKHVWTRIVVTLGQMIIRAGLVSVRTRAELELTLASVGLHVRNNLEIFIGSKIILLIGLPPLAIMALHGISLPRMLSIVIPAGAALAGLLLPDMVVRYRRKRYLQRVERGLPDALDLLVICSQAGLGLTAAIIRVAEEMKLGRQDIGNELALTAHDLQFVTDSRQALLKMGSRTGIDGLVRLGTTLVQSMQYGTPLSQSMRALSAEMRQDTLTRFENKAARIGVLLTLPMVVFILPCVFLVVGGPAAVQVFRIGSQ
jgi:tight adherence protein C